MKFKIKSLATLFVSFLLAYTMTSCDDNANSLGKFEIRKATAHTSSNGVVESFTLDNGKTLFIAAPININYKPKYERVYINYTLLGDNYGGYDHAIKLNGIDQILTQPVIYVSPDNKEEQDKIGYNKIRLQSATAIANYIDILFVYNMGRKDSHDINLVALDENLKQSEDKPIKLQFRHNINNDEELFGSGTVIPVAFKIDKYIEANKGKEKIIFEISWEDYDGQTKTTLTEYIMPKAALPKVESSQK